LMMMMMMMQWRLRTCISVYLPVILLIFLLYCHLSPSWTLPSSSIARPHLFRSLPTSKILTWLSCLPHARPPTWKTRISRFVWVIYFDLSFTAGSTYSFQDHLTTERILQWYWTHILSVKSLESSGVT
jgi:hypothetical protein